KVRPARKGRNPRTGETLDIPASRSIGFKAGSALRTVPEK
ncbi:MAG: HU family DNA-binding protein, partial [Oscillospiraceae bacterium]|nr:HU family DNA-binding protein [Oscillospiraceae bacterium]